jgi:hypothetical protein
MFIPDKPASYQIVLNIEITLVLGYIYLTCIYYKCLMKMIRRQFLILGIFGTTCLVLPGCNNGESNLISGQGTGPGLVLGGGQYID